MFSEVLSSACLPLHTDYLRPPLVGRRIESRCLEVNREKLNWMSDGLSTMSVLCEVLQLYEKYQTHVTQIRPELSFRACQTVTSYFQHNP